MNLPEPLPFALLRQRRDELISQLDEAFSNVRLGNGIGLREGYARDCYADNETLIAERAWDRMIQDWRDIDIIQMDPLFSSLCFVDEAGYRFALPAYIRHILKFDFAYLDNPEGHDSEHPIPEIHYLFSSNGAEFLPTESDVISRFILLHLEYDFSVQCHFDTEDRINVSPDPNALLYLGLRWAKSLPAALADEFTTRWNSILNQQSWA